MVSIVKMQGDPVGRQPGKQQRQQTGNLLRRGFPNRIGYGDFLDTEVGETFNFQVALYR